MMALLFSVAVASATLGFLAGRGTCAPAAAPMPPRLIPVRAWGPVHHPKGPVEPATIIDPSPATLADIAAEMKRLA